MRSGNLFCQHRMAADRQGGGRRLIHRARAGASGRVTVRCSWPNSSPLISGRGAVGADNQNLRQIVSRVIVVRRAAGEAAEDHRFLRRQHAAVQQLKQHALDAERVLVDILHHRGCRRGSPAATACR